MEEKHEFMNVLMEWNQFTAAAQSTKVKFISIQLFRMSWLIEFPLLKGFAAPPIIQKLEKFWIDGRNGLPLPFLFNFFQSNSNFQFDLMKKWKKREESSPAAASEPQTNHQSIFNWFDWVCFAFRGAAPFRQINSSTISSFLFFHQSFLHLLAANKFKEMNWLKRMKSWWIEWRWPMPHPAQQSQTIHNSHSQRELWNCFGCCWCCAAYPTGLH